jgi:hypothetical protein
MGYIEDMHDRWEQRKEQRAEQRELELYEAQAEAEEGIEHLEHAAEYMAAAAADGRFQPCNLNGAPITAIERVRQQVIYGAALNSRIKLAILDAWALQPAELEQIRRVWHVLQARDRAQAKRNGALDPTTP